MSFPKRGLPIFCINKIDGNVKYVHSNFVVFNKLKSGKISQYLRQRHAKTEDHILKIPWPVAFGRNCFNWDTVLLKQKRKKVFT